MKRKRFLGSLLGSPLLAAATFQSADGVRAASLDQMPWLIPPYLKPGDTIGITCPAGFMTLAELQPAIKVLQDWGFILRIGTKFGGRGWLLTVNCISKLLRLIFYLWFCGAPGGSLAGKAGWTYSFTQRLFRQCGR